MRRTILLLISATMMLCAATGTAKNTTSTTYKGNKMDRNLFSKEPIYKLKMRGNGKFIVFINGVDVFRSFEKGNHALITVNDYIVNGDNNISLTLIDRPKLSPKAWGVVSLEVYYTDKLGKSRHHTLSRLVYDLTLKDKTGDASKPGFYRFDDDKGMIPDANGSLIIGKIVTKPETMYRRTKADGIKATQSVRIPAPYPRWRFLDAPNIIDSDYDYLSEEEYNKLKQSPKIQALYALDAKIRKAFKEKRIQSVVNLFNERFEEFASAFYDTVPNLKKGYIAFVQEYANNPDCELVEYPNPDDLYFVIEKNRKLVWIRPIEFHNKKTGIYRSYDIKYRLNKQGEWVITR